MDRDKAIEAFKAPVKENHWSEEDCVNLLTPQNATLHLSRIVFTGEGEASGQKRCISVTKNGKSVAFDIEMAFAVAAVVQKLGEKYVPSELQ